MSDSPQNEIFREVVIKYSQPQEVAEFSRLSRTSLYPFEKALFEKYMGKGGLVLNMGCGAGREALVLAKAGYRYAQWISRDPCL